MTNDNRGPRLAFSEHVYDYDQDKYHDLPDGSYVAVEDIPAIVATELERLAAEDSQEVISTDDIEHHEGAEFRAVHADDITHRAAELRKAGA